MVVYATVGRDDISCSLWAQNSCTHVSRPPCVNVAWVPDFYIAFDQPRILSLLAVLVELASERSIIRGV